MIHAVTYPTARLAQHALVRPGGETVVLLVHGNGSSSVFWKDLMARLPERFTALAPDTRGYGATEARPIDATRGFGDVVDDLIALLDHLGHAQVHVVGHSLGGNILYALLGSHPERFASATLVNPGSPYGFGGSKGEQGEPCWPDFAGSGGGIANPVFVERLKADDRSLDDPNASPRAVMNTYYWHPSFTTPAEDELLDGLLAMQIGEQFYPGDFEASEHYPFVRPGVWGPLNAVSPKHLSDTVARFIEATASVPVLWVRGDQDQIVSDASLFDFGTLGTLGLIPNYPGEALYPPQPMVAQTRYVLEQRRAKGGAYSEVVMEGTGHSPYIERPDEFLAHVLPFWSP
ncbi:MAG: alpha/beta hydrolase [Bacteroidota bacterium]